MANQINISPQELEATLKAIGRQGSCVYSADKVRGFIILRLVGERKEIRHKLPRKRQPKKTTTAPVVLEK
jgi:hypothetical protein